MAVTLTVAELVQALRLGTTDEETAETTRLLAYATETVTRHLGTAFAATPATVVNEAAIRIAGYVYDSPHAPRGEGWANVIRNSGAAAILRPYRVHRAGGIGAEPLAPAATPAPAPSPGGGGDTDNPVTDVTVTGGQLTVTYADGSAQSFPLASSYVLPAAAPGTRGGVEAVTNAIIDTGTSTGVFGWMVSHVKRVADAAVAAVVSAAQVARIPAANPGGNQAWRTDADGTPAWRPDDDVANLERAVEGLRSVTRDLAIVGDVDALVQVEDAALAALYADTGGAIDQNDPQVDFEDVVNRPDQGWTATRVVVRLATTHDRADYRVRFTGDGLTHDIPGSHWQPLTVQNPSPGYAYFTAESGNLIGGSVDSLTLWSREHPTIYQGQLGPGVVTAASLADDVPTLPVATAANQLLAANNAKAWAAVARVPDTLVDFDSLAVALRGRVLPTGGSDGQVLGRASGAPAWMAAPSGGGAAPVALASNLAPTNNAFNVADADEATIAAALLAGTYDALRCEYVGSLTRATWDVPVGHRTWTRDGKWYYNLGVVPIDFETVVKVNVEWRIASDGTNVVRVQRLTLNDDSFVNWPSAGRLTIYGVS